MIRNPDKALKELADLVVEMTSPDVPRHIKDNLEVMARHKAKAALNGGDTDD